jgi:hypothetical protein
MRNWNLYLFIWLFRTYCFMKPKALSSQRLSIRLYPELVHIITTKFLNVHFYIVFILLSSSPKSAVSMRFLYENAGCCISCFTNVCHCPVHTSFHDLFTLTTLGILHFPYSSRIPWFTRNNWDNIFNYMYILWQFFIPHYQNLGFDRGERSNLCTESSTLRPDLDQNLGLSEKGSCMFNFLF